VRTDLPIPCHYVLTRDDEVLVNNTPPGVAFNDHSTIDCTPDAERTLDRRLVRAAVVGMAALQAR
jgi:hypothetical protein